MASPTEIMDTLEGRYAENIRVVVAEIADLRKQTGSKERERDRLLREAKPVMRRDKAAECAGLSLSRLDQIIGGA